MCRLDVAARWPRQYAGGMSTILPTNPANELPNPSRPQRVVSIDALRGFVMFTMIFVNDLAGAGMGNIGNGARPKMVLTENAGQVEIEVPRDRAGTFEPQIVKKRQRRLNGVDEVARSRTGRSMRLSGSRWPVSGTFSGSGPALAVRARSFGWRC